MSKADLKLDWCSYAAAKYAVEHWHYSQTLPTGKNNYVGAWENKRFVGCIIIGLGASAPLCKPYKLGVFQVCELVRVALAQHATPVSRMLSIATRMVKRKNPGLRLCVSFADPNHGHHGGIYQAAGWVYSGDSSSSYMIRLRDGRLTHMRQWSGQGWNAAKQLPQGSCKVLVPGKHRYLMAFDAAMRAQIEPLRKPYPKRAGSIASDVSANQAGEGGATPTSALFTTPKAPK